MKFWTTAKRQRDCRFAVVGLMLMLWLGTLALVASPQLHRLLHSDAQNLNHHCLITQVQQHPLLSGSSPIIAAAPPQIEAGPGGCAEFQLLQTFDYQVSSSRAPPAIVPVKTIAGREVV